MNRRSWRYRLTDRRRLLWLWLTHTTFNQRAAFVLALLVIGQMVRSEIRTDHIISRVSADEYTTCRIQQKALPANKHLAVAIAEIPLFLRSLPPVVHVTPGQPTTLKYLRGLEYHSEAYGARERTLPATRKCVR